MSIRRALLRSPHAESAQAERGNQGWHVPLGQTSKKRRASSFSASPSANPVGVRKRRAKPPWTHQSACALRMHRVAVIAPAAARRRTPPAAVPPSARRRRRRSAAKIVNGIAIPPIGAPARVKKAIAAANRIVTKPYIYGGGHSAYRSATPSAPRSTRATTAPAPSASRSTAAGFLKSPLDSGSFMKLGPQGQGPLDHRLHEPRPRLRRDRRAAPRHLPAVA